MIKKKREKIWANANFKTYETDGGFSDNSFFLWDPLHPIKAHPLPPSALFLALSSSPRKWTSNLWTWTGTNISQGAASPHHRRRRPRRPRFPSRSSPTTNSRRRSSVWRKPSPSASRTSSLTRAASSDPSISTAATSSTAETLPASKRSHSFNRFCNFLMRNCNLLGF